MPPRNRKGSERRKCSFPNFRGRIKYKYVQLERKGGGELENLLCVSEILTTLTLNALVSRQFLIPNQLVPKYIAHLKRVQKCSNNNHLTSFSKVLQYLKYAQYNNRGIFPDLFF